MDGAKVATSTNRSVSVVVSPRPGIAERLAELIRCETVSAGLPEPLIEASLAPFSAFLEKLRELYPLTHERLTVERIGELGVLLHWRADGTESAAPAAGPVVLMAHFDVVPVESPDSWEFPPFSGTIANGFVWGRGALDDKGALVVLFDAVENLLAAGFTPARDIYISLGGNEETFGSAAAGIAAELRSRGVQPWLVLDEGGAVTDAPLPWVRAQAAMVGVGEKGQVSVRITAKGQDGHASVPPAQPAIRVLSQAIRKLSPSIFKPRTPAAVQRMLGIFAPYSKQPGKLLYRALSSSRWLNGVLFARLGGEAAAMVRTTIAPTRVQGGSANNVLPNRASAVLNMRIALGSSVAETVRTVRRNLPREVELEVLEQAEPSPESRTDSPQFSLIRNAVAASYSEALAVPYVTMAATDSRYFHTFCPATFRFAPLFMDAELRGSVHGENERVAISSLERGELFYRALIEGIPSAK